MRHLKSGRKLNRTSAHRQAMFRNLAASFIKYGSIRTTLPKAKELRVFVEPLITLAKEDKLANRRQAFAKLGNKEAVGKLFSTTSKLCLARPGGYLSIIKDGLRAGDKAPMARVYLVDATDDYAEINYEKPESPAKAAKSAAKAAAAKSAKNTKAKQQTAAKTDA